MTSTSSLSDVEKFPLVAQQGSELLRFEHDLHVRFRQAVLLMQ